MSKPLFVRLWVPVEQGNLHLPLAVDPVRMVWLCNMEAVSISNTSIKDGLIPICYVPRGTGLPKNGLLMGRLEDDLLPFL